MSVNTKVRSPMAAIRNLQQRVNRLEKRRAGDSSGGGGSTVLRGIYYPETYGAVGDGLTDDTIGIQGAIDAAAAAGGGVVFLSTWYGWKGDITHKTGVTVQGSGTSAFGTANTCGLIALDALARYRFGDLSGPGANPYPGVLSNLVINGNNLGGSTELLRIEAVDAMIRDCVVINGTGNGVVFAAAQNTIYDGGSIYNFPNGTAVLFRNRDDGGAVNTQGAGGCKVHDLHVSAANKLVGSDYVITNVGDPAGFWPHDNFVTNCLFEQYQDDYHSLAHIEDGEIQFLLCVFTGSSGTGPATSDAVVLVENEFRDTNPTVVTFTDCYFGGGAASPTDAIRSVSYGLANTIRVLGRSVFTNVDYGLCDDRGGGGLGLVGSIDGACDLAVGVTLSRGINGGNAASLVNTRLMPTRHTMDASQGDPLQIRRDTDTTNRWSVTRDGGIKWFNGSDGTTRASIQRTNNGLAINGDNYLQMAAVPTGSFASAASLPRFMVLDSTLAKPKWSDGTDWRNALGSDHALRAGNQPPTGALATTLERNGVNGANITTFLLDGRLTMVQIEIKEACVVSNVVFATGTTAGAGLTHRWAALFDSARNLLSQSADNTSATMAASTAHSFALGAAQVLLPGTYYIGLMVAGTTMPSLQGSSVTTVVANTVPPIACGTSDTGLTTTAPNPAAALTPIASTPWAWVT